MSSTTYAPASAGDHDDFDRIAFDLVVDGFDTDPVAGTTSLARRHRSSRQVEQTEAIRESLGEYRHRTNERRG